jgi:hypothetical protein
LYAAYIGPRWEEHYKEAFFAYIAAPSALALGWNWSAAFSLICSWSIRRKLYWIFAAQLILVLMALTIPGSIGVLLLLSFVVFGMTGDHWVFDRATRAIVGARAHSADNNVQLRLVALAGGVHEWTWLIDVLGWILLATAILPYVLLLYWASQGDKALNNGKVDSTALYSEERDSLKAIPSSSRDSELPGLGRATPIDTSRSRVQPDTDSATKPSLSLGYTVSFAVLLSEDTAQQLARSINVDGTTAHVAYINAGGPPLFRVEIGPFATREEADNFGRASKRDYWIREGP